MTSSTSSSMMNYPACLADMSAATLFIGELMPHVNEVILYKKFAPMGTVTSVKLCRDWITGKSLCYAYVNFENPAEAEKAYRSLNYELLEGQPMRIMKSTRNPWLESREDTGCCFHHHHHHHRCCGGGGGGGGGGISGGGGGGSNKDLMDPHILVEAIESYSRALKDADENKAPTGYKYSKEFLKRMNIANTQFTNVFIKNFKDLLDDYKLFRLCKPFGEVTSAKVMVDEYGISKGFGFACFTDSDAAQRAVNKLNGLVLDGRTLFAGPALTKSERVKDWGGTRGDYDNCYNKHQQQQPPQEPSHVSISPRICIRNLRDVVDEVRLRKEFERFGPVQQVELLTDNEGRSKGTGYVMYEDQTDAIKAVNSMNGKMIYGARIGVNYVPYTATAATNTYPDTFLLSNHHQQQQNQQNHHQQQQKEEHPPHQQQRQHAFTNTNNQRHYNNHHSQPRLHNSPKNNGVRTTGRNNDENDRDWENYDCSGLNTSVDSGRGGGIGGGCHGKDSGDNKENVACGTDVDCGVGTGGGGVGGDCNGDCRGSCGGSGISGGVGGGGSGVNGGSGGGGGSGNKQQVYLQLKDLASSLAHRGHPINIKDIDTSFGNVTNNRNASNNNEINTSNNAVKTVSASSSTEANNNNSFEGASSSSTTTAPTSRRIMTMYANDKNNGKYDDDHDDDDDDKRTIKTTRVNSNDNDHDDNDSDGDDTRTGKATLLVKNLDESITDYKLESLFNVYGPVVSAKVVSSEFGVSKGFGFVIMAEAQDAVKAIKNLDGRIVVNRPIYISPTAQTKLSAK